MSKQIKQMEMDALKSSFGGVRDMVMFTASGIDATVNNQTRLALRKKNIRVQLVKNSLARRVFDEAGFKLTTPWSGPTYIAWGAGSLAELSKELAAHAKKNEKWQPKSAVSEGMEITFQQALAMPTRAEALGKVVGIILSPAARLVAQLTAPASQVAGQIKTLSEKAPAGESAAS
jgi:large subunit ribosomal protein L10